MTRDKDTPTTGEYRSAGSLAGRFLLTASGLFSRLWEWARSDAKMTPGWWIIPGAMLGFTIWAITITSIAMAIL